MFSCCYLPYFSYRLIAYFQSSRNLSLYRSVYHNFKSYDIITNQNDKISSLMVNIYGISERWFTLQIRWGNIKPHTVLFLPRVIRLKLRSATVGCIFCTLLILFSNCIALLNACKILLNYFTYYNKQLANDNFKYIHFVPGLKKIIWRKVAWACHPCCAAL